jgi:adenine deaminase
LYDRGGIAPGLRADLALVDDLKDFRVRRVFIAGKEAAKEGKYLLPVKRSDDTAVWSSFHVKNFSVEKLALPFTGDEAWVIDISPSTVVTRKRKAAVKRDAAGCFVRDPEADIVKIAAVERHQNTGNVAVALIRGYGIRRGAIAQSIAHDSHNIIAAGIDDREIAFAVEKLLEQNGGVTLVSDGRVIERMPLPLGGLVSDRSGEWVAEKLTALHHAAHRELGVNPALEPVMSLCFMSLPVIPELKITDMGLFDVERFAFIPVSVQ